jgi:hypothetical protein
MSGVELTATCAVLRALLAMLEKYSSLRIGKLTMSGLELSATCPVFEAVPDQ